MTHLAAAPQLVPTTHRHETEALGGTTAAPEIPSWPSDVFHSLLPAAVTLMAITSGLSSVASAESPRRSGWPG